MAKSKPKRKVPPTVSSRDEAGTKRAEPAHSTERLKQPMYLPADPPRPNRVGLIASILLFVVWFALLVYIALSGGSVRSE